jgi:REP element-mobilizing transposase RayT
MYPYDARKSLLHHGDIYFWTATIHRWQHLLEKDEYKQIILNSLEYLSDRKMIEVFAFVIMPNHIHLIWRILTPNGKESPQVSLLKYTAHLFRKTLYNENKSQLLAYAINASNKQHQFWQRDSLGIRLYTPKVAFQKLHYLHNNPVAKHWKLVPDPCDYWYSSIRLYEKNKNDFSFLKDLREVM